MICQSTLFIHDMSTYIIYLKSHDPIIKKFYGHGENDNFILYMYMYVYVYIWLNNTVDFSIKNPMKTIQKM